MIASTCDHFTRVSTGGSKLAADSPVYGLLFGTRNEAYSSICDSVDMNYTFSGGDIQVLPGEIDSKSKLWTAVFTTYTLIGWYAFGQKPTSDHKKIHKMISTYTADPLFLIINQTSAADSDQLPLNVYSASNGTDFAEIAFRIETTDVEKLAVDHITKSTPVPGLSALEVQNQSTLTSLRILDSKVGTIVETLQAMKEGKIPVDHALLRRAAKICQSLPPVDSVALKKQYDSETTNSLLIAYLSTATQTTGQLMDVADVYNSVYADRGFSNQL